MAKNRMMPDTTLRLSCVQKEMTDKLRRLTAVRWLMSESPAAAPKSPVAGGDAFCGMTSQGLVKQEMKFQHLGQAVKPDNMASASQAVRHSARPGVAGCSVARL